MKIVVAPDSFKGSISTQEAAAAIRAGVLRADPNSDVTIIPMADGGEGTINAITSTIHCKKVSTRVQDPLGRETIATVAILEDQTCIIEMAQACGLGLITATERNPLRTSTYGLGQLIQAGLDQGCRQFIVGLGGSATNDAGVGMLQSLGYRFLDREGNEIGCGGGELGKIHTIDQAHIDPRLGESRFTIACDVDNPLIGPAGASYIYAPQKGATPEMVELLEQNLSHFADLVESTLGVQIHSHPGAGAAGGVAGALLAFFDGKLEAGVKIIATVTKLEQAIATADLVITGEGKIDEQTIHGKTAFGVARIAKTYNVPTIALVGSIGKGVEQLYPHGFTAVFSIINKPLTLDEAVSQTAPLLIETTEQVIRLCKHLCLFPISKEIIENR